MEIQSLEIVEIPKVALLEGLEYWTAKKEQYSKLDMPAMESWADGKANVYKHLLDTYTI